MPLLIVLIGVIVLILLITKLKLNTFVSLVIVAFIVGLTLGIPVANIPTSIETGIGGQLGHLAVIFGFGSMLGKLISDSGGGFRIANKLISTFGKKRIQIAVILTSFIIGLALFFEVGLVVLLPIIFVIAREVDMPLLYLGIPMAATLNVAHGFLPPHPAPTAVAQALNAPLGNVLLLGIIVSIPTIIISGPIFNYFLHRFYPSAYHKDVDVSVLGHYKEFKLAETPGFTISVITALLPVILISVATIFSFILPKTNVINETIQFIGAPDAAMLISLLIAIFTMGLLRGKKIKEIGNSMTAAVQQISMMLLIIGGGGAFRQVLVDGGVSKYIGQLFSQTSLSPIFVAWLIAALLRVSLGSSTVASITAASLVTSVVTNSGVNPALIVLAIGAGSVFADHVNDAGFWMIKEYFGLSLKETFLSWTTLTSVISVAGLLSILALSMFM
ncbi:gluconate:H+ symporter [Oenococcus kitaharae]|uniref:Gluconate permease n=1 Tax=Oenococcus kitaharae DSM 17330 TaxID=1045004 RepID=G9WGF9_9LACO|nr:gluconate:H+ symporter [Oenococcus kitaharae]EHN59786.1 Gluconate permease [Oenococcus kitaharae DSM 17330]OEY83606.1 gluconate permease [Oenococcus kitaharae]OEY85404.1 gluconate permease [Oenococcus kitaharae]OEY86257.1 gluconate permease [Oenococcus kitaharae]